MPPCGEELHQSVSPVLAVQTEGQRHKRAAHPHARDKACHLIDSAHIKYDYENENGEQAAGEEEEAPEPTLSENIIKLQIIDNHILYTMQSKSKSF